MRAATGSRLAKPRRSGAPKGSLEAVAASWIIEREEDGYAPHGPECLLSQPDLHACGVWSGVRRAGLPRLSPPLTPASGAAGAALSTPGMGDRLGVKVPWRKRWC